ncbi:MAG: HD domain-containing protein [Candidatus Nanoarchaeia archaeon]
MRKQEITIVAEKLGLSKKVTDIYNEIYSLFPPDTGKPELQYTRRTWIFPQHFNIMIKMASKMCEKYDGNIVICHLAIILHDVGLVYNRTSASPDGHEDRGIEYAKEILAKHGYDKEVIVQIIRCINVTNAEVEPVTINEKIVRTADALSKFDSCHFIAKAAYSKDIDEYMTWMHKKLKKSYYKICFDDELKDCETAYKYLMQAVESYRKQKEEFS